MRSVLSEVAEKSSDISLSVRAKIESILKTADEDFGESCLTNRHFFTRGKGIDPAVRIRFAKNPSPTPEQKVAWSRQIKMPINQVEYQVGRLMGEKSTRTRSFPNMEYTLEDDLRPENSTNIY